MMGEWGGGLWCRSEGGTPIMQPIHHIIDLPWRPMRLPGTRSLGKGEQVSCLVAWRYFLKGTKRLGTYVPSCSHVPPVVATIQGSSLQTAMVAKAWGVMVLSIGSSEPTLDSSLWQGSHDSSALAHYPSLLSWSDSWYSPTLDTSTPICAMQKNWAGKDDCRVQEFKGVPTTYGV